MGRGVITSTPWNGNSRGREGLNQKSPFWGEGDEYSLELHNSINAKTLFIWCEVVSLIDELMATL